MNPNQYSCNTLRLFLAHTLNYQWLSFWQGDENSYFYQTFLEIIVNDLETYMSLWDINISFIKKTEIEFSIGSYQYTEYHGRTDFYSFNWMVYFK